MNIFTWAPSFGSGIESELRLNEVEFGDGYYQTSPDGLNADLKSLPLTWSNKNQTDADAIEAFLSAQNGDAFFFTMPGKTQKIYRCKKWKNTYNTYNNYTITATFMQVPA